MPDSDASVVEADHSKVIAALRKASEIITARGYQPLYGSTKGGPVNISNALTLAADDYDTYLKARQAFSKNFGGPVEGLVYWETYKRRNKMEVLALLAEVVDRLEKNEARPVGPTRPARGGSSSRIS